MRHLRRMFAVALLLTVAACQTNPAQDTPGAEEFGVTILSINLRDILNHPEPATGVPWQERYSRIGRWIAGAPLKPDFIVLQEAPGFWACGSDLLSPDYSALDFLLEDIRVSTGEKYRIAYFNSDKEGMAVPGIFVGTKDGAGCRVRGGKALLYRSSRVRNVLASESGVVAYDVQTTIGPHSINSMPCCFPDSNHLNVCSIIDGPPQVTPRCTTPSPKGVSWTNRHLGRNNELVTSAAFDRFELVHQPGNYIHIYNVHLVPLNPTWDQTNGAASINALVDAMEARFDPRNNSRLYPPILIGDFNIDRPGIEHNNPPNPPDPANPRPPFFPRFDVAFWSPVNTHPTPSGVTGALIGKPSLFPSKQNAYVNNALALPAPGCEINGGSPLTLWSDHCAIYLRIEPAP